MLTEIALLVACVMLSVIYQSITASKQEHKSRLIPIRSSESTRYQLKNNRK